MLSPFWLCILAITLLAALGLPIGHAMIVSSIFYLLLSGLDLGTAAEQILNGLFNSYVLLAIPLFILAADLMNIGSLTDRLLQFCLVLVGRFRGGLGHVNVVANMIFAGMSGSAIADAVGVGRIIIGMMTKDGGYPVAYAGAITASAAIIGPIIPPSIPMVLYALISDTSIGYLFIGGFVPGVMLGIAFMVMNFGIVVVVNIMIGLVTPPYGLLLFVVANMTKQPLWSIVREAVPFILAAILV